MKRRTVIKFQQLAIILIIWPVFGFLISVYDHLLLHTQNSLGTAETYSFWPVVIQNVASGLAGALLGGSFMVFFVNEKYKDKPYGYTIMAVVAALIFVLALVTVIIGTILVPLRTQRPIADPVTRQALIKFVADGYALKSSLVWLLIVATTQLLLQVNSKFGYGSFWNFIRGKYQTPTTERMIFMFLDINQSTTIAERLGDETYHSLLKDFFNDITNPILDSKGSIYQYVGDEVVISWKIEDGRDNANCIQCFFLLKEFIQMQEEKYVSHYGIVPTFKAGLHCGNVVAGEVGIIKRDITYSGDVLNTTSRIQGMCKEFGVEFVVSHHVLKEILMPESFELKELGSIKLRGKENDLLLVSITKTAKPL